MHPIFFKEATRRLQALPPPEAADFFPEYTHRDGLTTTACYALTWRERFSALFFGRVWLSCKTKEPETPPIYLQAKRSPFLKPSRTVGMVAKSSCKKCHGTGSTGRDTITGRDLICECLVAKTELREQDKIIQRGAPVKPAGSP